MVVNRGIQIFRFCLWAAMEGDYMSKTVLTTREIELAVAPLLKRYRAEKAILFGSYARNEATPQSDIDLVITGGTEFDPTDVFCIADELYRMLGKNVDVYELREIDTGSDFYHTIHREGVQIA